MFRKPPPEFNAAWYVATYPDVALSGMSPREHYRRFGRLMGRKPAPPPKAPKSPPVAASTDRSVDKIPNAQVQLQSVRLSGRADPIIGRPAGFDAAAVLPSAAPSRNGSGGSDSCDVQALAMGPFASEEERHQFCAPLIAYARMMALDLPPDLIEPQGPMRCASARFRVGETRLENAWFASASVLRLRFAGGTDTTSSSQGWALRAYQFDPKTPGGLIPVGQGTEFPVFGPIFHDMELHHPLMPLLMELSDADGVTRGLALLPFPSLLPGGMHGAELNALQSEANPMDAFWSLSDLLVQELLGQPGWADRSIFAISVMADESRPSEALRPEVQLWLATLFGLGSSPARGATSLQRKGASSGFELMLPCDCLPSISALVSRRFEMDGATALAGPLLVAEFPSFRPRWSVMLPAQGGRDTAFPILRPAASLAEGHSPSKTVPVHLAIALRSADLQGEASAPGAELAASGNNETPAIGAMTIVVDASNPGRTERLLHSMKEAAGEAAIELIIRLPEPNGDLPEAIDRAWGSGNWKAVPADADLRELASGARHEKLLTVSDRVISIDRAVMNELCAILKDDEGVASASCVLLAEVIIKKKAIVQPATGGLFPAGVSFSSAPHLAFSEPDVRQALPDMTYPVVANTLYLTVWRRNALAELRGPHGPVPSTAQDIRIGLDLLEAGYRNVCTSRVTARLTGSYARRDAIDPVGSTYLHPARWEDVLSRVTVLRELF